MRTFEQYKDAPKPSRVIEAVVENDLSLLVAPPEEPDQSVEVKII